MTLQQYPNRIKVPDVGDRIGDCVILDVVAEGGMSYIYKVKNEKLEVHRVIKLIKSIEDIDLDRFKTEARISANLNHPNIVQCYNFDKDPKSTLPYIEMEYIDGINLHQLIKNNGPLPIPVACAIAYYICKALNAVHGCQYTLYDVARKGIVHRDIKPANILIANNGTVKLADFGIAKPKELTMHTAGFQIVGSPFYLSPEQLKKEELDFRTDIYSLGCVIYEMITGTRAYTQDNISDLAIAKSKGYFETSILRYVPDKLRMIIITCMKSDKYDRFDTCEEVMEALDSFLKSMNISGYEELIVNYLKEPVKYYYSLPHLQKKQKKIRRWLIFTISIAGLCCLAFSTLFIVSRHKKKIALRSTGAIVEPQSKAIPATTETPEVQPQTPTPISQENARQPASKTDQAPHVAKPPLIVEKARQQMVNKPAQNAVTRFIQGDYSGSLNLLIKTESSMLSDTEYLCLLGSLLQTNSFAQLSDAIKQRNVSKDGYYNFIKGRIDYLNNNYPSAVDHFSQALSKKSFLPQLHNQASYYLVKTQQNLYMQKPNIQNKLNLKNSLEQHLIRYCMDVKSEQCREITEIMGETK